MFKKNEKLIKKIMLSESELLCLYFWISNIAIMHLCHWVAMHILAGLAITQVT
jgi:hypothetical protein